MKPMVIVAGKKAEHNPGKDRLSIQFFFRKQNGGGETPG